MLTTVKGKSLRDGLRPPLDNMRVAAEQATMLYEELLKALAENKTGKDFERKLLEMWNFRDAIARSAMLENSSEARSSL